MLFRSGVATIGNNKVDLTTKVTGVLTITNGGTGSTTTPMVGLITAANETAARNILLLGTAATTDATDYATASQGTKADSALQRTGGTMTGDINMGANNISSTGTITATTFIGNLTGNVDTATKIASISNNNIVQLTETQTLTNKTLISPKITGTGNIYGAFTGDLTGNVTGDLTGNVIGNLVT